MTRLCFVLACFTLTTATLPSLEARDRKPKSLSPLASVLLSVNPAFASRALKTSARNPHIRLDDDFAAFERELALLEGRAVDQPKETATAPEPTTTPAPTTTRAPTTTKKPGPRPKEGLQSLIASYTIDGNKMPMSDLADTPVLIVNVASKCGTAKKVYRQIHDWHLKYPDTLKILLFPSNEFGRAELPFEEIKPFLETFEPTVGMPVDGPVFLMDRSSINGKFPHPIWEYAKKCFPGDIRWNFEGFFLFDKAGICVGRFNKKELDELSGALEAVM